MPRIPRIALPPSTLVVCVLASAYALLGLFGHDPWKPEDAVGVGIVHRMVAHGQWLLPNLAGEVYTADGPFFYWLSAAVSWPASLVLSFDDGARMASGVAVIAALLLLRTVGRELNGKSAGDGAMLVLIGCLGLMLHAHETLGELGMLLGHALAWYGIALALRKPHKGGIALGLGLAAALMSKGPVAIIAPALTLALLCLISGNWRTRRFASSLLEAAGVFAATAGTWALVATLSAPEAWAAWWAAQWNGIAWPTPARAVYDFKVLSWASWPAWPIALWLLWDRRKALNDPGILLGSAASLASLLVFLAHGEEREVNALACLLPLSLLAGAGIERLRRGAAKALEWFGAITFSFFGVLVWLGWFAMTTGMPARIARNFAKLEPGHVPRFEWLVFLVALGLTIAWIVVLARSERSVYRSVLVWACGATMLWGLVMSLLLSWIDYGKTYGPVARSLSAALKKSFPAGVPCIESRSLGESQRAAFDYHAGIVTRRLEARAPSACPALLVQARPEDKDPVLGRSWRRVWEGNRPRDNERYRLYVGRER